MTVSQNVRFKRVKRRVQASGRSQEFDLRPTRREATELVSALSQCNFAANALLAEMEHGVMLLKDARLEADTALAIAANSNKNASLRDAKASVAL